MLHPIAAAWHFIRCTQGPLRRLTEAMVREGPPDLRVVGNPTLGVSGTLALRS